MRRVKFSFFGKEYEVFSDSPDENIEFVRDKIRDIQLELRSLADEVSLDELLFLALCEQIEKQYISSKEFDKLIERLKRIEVGNEKRTGEK